MVACSGTTTTLNRQKATDDGGGATTGSAGSTGDDGGPAAGGAGGIGGATGGEGGAVTGGNTGDGGSPPSVPGVTVSNKLDLLIVVDNSSSMADKQDVLANTLPDLVTRLPGVEDLHVGVITSSLGGHGAPGPSGQPHLCEVAEDRNDHAHLLGTRPRGVGLGLANGFIEWTPAAGAATLSTQVRDLVRAAGQGGCGLESQFEAMYRFLADPFPPLNIVLQGSPPRATAQGIDNEILAQRSAFLRPDSVLAVVMLTDENDCSIRDTDQYYYAAVLEGILPQAASVCGINPNDPCCYSCGLAPPAGCTPDPKCGPPPPSLTTTDDQQNLRCFEQKRRFGIDFLYPVKRYVNTLRSATLCTTRADLTPEGNCPARADGSAGHVPNPLYQDLSNTGAPTRSSSMVHILGIVGAPWQALQAATDDQGNAYPAGELHYRSSSQLASSGTWAQVLGNLAASPPVLPADPHLQESVDPRVGIPGPNEGLMSDPMVGHEWVISRRNDLQYACIFPLPQQGPCVDNTCDCFDRQPGDNNPLCQDPSGNYVSTQFYAKAYPGLRELELVKQLSGIAASICPRNLTDGNAQDFGYRPALEALARDLGSSLP